MNGETELWDCLEGCSPKSSNWPPCGGWNKEYRSGKPRALELNADVCSAGDTGWIKDSAGRRTYYPTDNYLEERSMNRRSALVYFDEPTPVAGAPTETAAGYRRATWFLEMEWVKPVSVID